MSSPGRPPLCYRLVAMPQSQEFDEAALDFAKFCLRQPASHLTDSWRNMAGKPDGYNTGPEAFADKDDLQYDDDIGDVLPIICLALRDLAASVNHSGGQFISEELGQNGAEDYTQGVIFIEFWR